MIPVRWVPEWFPGAGFQKTAKEIRELVADFGSAPVDFVRDRMVVQVFSSFMIQLFTLFPFSSLPPMLPNIKPVELSPAVDRLAPTQPATRSLGAEADESQG